MKIRIRSSVSIGSFFLGIWGIYCLFEGVHSAVFNEPVGNLTLKVTQDYIILPSAESYLLEGGLWIGWGAFLVILGVCLLTRSFRTARPS